MCGSVLHEPSRELLHALVHVVLGGIVGELGKTVLVAVVFQPFHHDGHRLSANNAPPDLRDGSS